MTALRRCFGLQHPLEKLFFKEAAPPQHRVCVGNSKEAPQPGVLGWAGSGGNQLCLEVTLIEGLNLVPRAPASPRVQRGSGRAGIAPGKPRHRLLSSDCKPPGGLNALKGAGPVQTVINGKASAREK